MPADDGLADARRERASPDAEPSADDPVGAAPAAAVSGSARGQFLLGLAIGAIPLVMAEIGIGGASHGGYGSGYVGSYVDLLLVAFVLYVVSGIVLLTQSVYSRVGAIGKGMLVALGASAVIFAFSCAVVPRL